MKQIRGIKEVVKEMETRQYWKHKHLFYLWLYDIFYPTHFRQAVIYFNARGEVINVLLHVVR